MDCTDEREESGEGHCSCYEIRECCYCGRMASVEEDVVEAPAPDSVRDGAAGE
jgi:hypothetical protein